MAALLLAACTTIDGITPIYPKAELNQTVDSLQPTFRWEPVAGANVRYDFIILEALGGGRYPGVGKEVYFREGLQVPEHTLKVSLQPDQEYYWSVRVRRGEEVSEWSAFDDVHYGTREYPFFRFRTPSK